MLNMIRLKRILVPTDFSEYSRPALQYGCAIAERFGSELHVLHV
ncbi:MAG: universal stress protein, partial [Phycisphaerae bacterium]